MGLVSSFKHFFVGLCNGYKVKNCAQSASVIIKMFSWGGGCKVNSVKKCMFLRILLAIKIVLVYWVNFHIIMQHLNNILLNFHWKILKIDRKAVNLRRRLEKKLFCGVHHNSQQNHLKQKNQSAFVKGNVSLGNPGITWFFSDFSILRSTWKPKYRFSLKKSAYLLF